MMVWIREYLDITIFALLGIMSFIALMYTIERYVHLARVDVRKFDQLESLKLDVSRHLSVIATIGSNAPYIGLLGTVFGIMVTFYDIGQSGQVDTKSIMVGLALALKATAFGLLVAIPSMVFYNSLVNRAEVLVSRWKIAHRVSDID